jgi:hypothetical protein
MTDKEQGLLVLPGAPDIPGLVFRRYRGEEDILSR